MKKFSQLITLLPCHSLEEFPERCSRSHAKNLLAAWTGLWHPELIASAEKAPTWLPASGTVSSDTEAEQFRESFIHQHYYDDDHAGADFDVGDVDFDAEVFEAKWQHCLVVVPTVAKPHVFSGFVPAVSGLGADVVMDFESRSDLLSRMQVHSDIPPELVSDFFALAYVRLQVELMTRKLRYSSDLDGERFKEASVAAALAAKSGDEMEAKRLLQSAFDLLTEEKNQYYPVAADLVDMVMLSSSIRPESIRAELENENPKTFVMTGETLQSVADHDPEIVKTMCDKLNDGAISVIAGPENELPEDLLSPETSLNQLTRSVATFEAILEATPKVFMRRRAGLHASLPGILKSCGFNAAVHATIDQGEIPETYSNSMRWMGIDGSALMAIGETPLDASNDKSFLDLGVRIGRELDSAHVSTIFFARWPTQNCDSLEDVRNATKYGNILGEFTDADSYFDNVYDPGYGDSWESDEYVGPWFEQAVKSDSMRPVSTFVDYWKHFYWLAAIQNMQSMCAIKKVAVPQELALRVDQLQTKIELETKDWDSEPNESITGELEELVNELRERLDAKFISTVPWKRTSYFVSPTPEGGSGDFAGKDAIKFAARDGDRCDAVVSLSGFGQLHIDPSSVIESSKPVEGPMVDDQESILRNEHFEVRVDSQTGGIRGIHFYGKRGNLVSQQLAVRQVDPSTKNIRYSKMVCDSLEVIRRSRIASEVRTEGSLVDTDGASLAKFSQTVSLQRGCEVIDFEIELSEVNVELSVSNYIVNRIAWSDETAELFCDMQGNRHAIRKPKIEAPHYIEVTQGENRFALLTKGLPWHRRTSKKKLDSILVAGNEARRTFQLGLAINPESSMQLAVSEMHPKPIQIGECSSDPEAVEASWLLHLANRNVIVTSCIAMTNEEGSCRLQIRLQETDGKAGTLKLYCRGEIVSAAKQSLDGEHLRDITLDSDANRKSSDYCVIETTFAGSEYFQLELSLA